MSIGGRGTTETATKSSECVAFRCMYSCAAQSLFRRAKGGGGRCTRHRARAERCDKRERGRSVVEGHISIDIIDVKSQGLCCRGLVWRVRRWGNSVYDDYIFDWLHLDRPTTRQDSMHSIMQAFNNEASIDEAMPRACLFISRLLTMTEVCANPVGVLSRLFDR